MGLTVTSGPAEPAFLLGSSRGGGGGGRGHKTCKVNSHGHRHGYWEASTGIDRGQVPGVDPPASSSTGRGVLGQEPFSLTLRGMGEINK